MNEFKERKPRQKKQLPSLERKQLPQNLDGYQTLQTYGDYVSLIEKTINGVLTGSVDNKTANSVAVLTGYGLQALRQATGGKMKMTVFMQNMKQVKVEKLTAEEMDRFLQGDENTQIEVLQQLEDRGGIVDATVRITPKEEPKAKVDIELIANMTGIEEAQVKDVLSGNIENVEIKRKIHKWEKSLDSTMNFCLDCGIEKEILEEEDLTSPCSGKWGL